jgi:hypothetical protein
LLWRLLVLNSFGAIAYILIGRQPRSAS